jgi:hypothetical protein
MNLVKTTKIIANKTQTNIVNDDRQKGKLSTDNRKWESSMCGMNINMGNVNRQ